MSVWEGEFNEFSPDNLMFSNNLSSIINWLGNKLLMLD